jgi:ribonuclease HII
MPDFSFERDEFVCGLDEVGRAPLAGPVVAACVFVFPEKRNHGVWRDVKDSKALTKKRREDLCPQIKEHVAWAIAEASAREIENINIIQATFLAMKRAYLAMCRDFDLTIKTALIDGNLAPALPCATQAIVKGDSKSVSIAAASILAKVYRDNLMADLAREHNHYGWERNVGYPTAEHMAAIDKHGITDHHRRSFAPVRNFMEFGVTKGQLGFRL